MGPERVAATAAKAVLTGEVHPTPSEHELSDWAKLVEDIGKAREGDSNDTEISLLFEAVCFAAQVARLPLPEWF